MPFNPSYDRSEFRDPFRKSEWGNVFSTYSRLLFPKTLNEVFDWAEFLWLHKGMYTQALKSAVRYFITKVEIYGTKDYKTRRKYREFLMEKIRVADTLGTVGDDFLAYGNSFTSVHQEFHRHLICPACSAMTPFKRQPYRWQDYAFAGECVHCGKSVVFKIHDISSKDDAIRVVRWNPRDMEVEWHPVTGSCRFYYKPCKDLVAGIKNGEPLCLEETPWELIEAVRDGTRFRFADGEVCHLKNDGLASMIDVCKGWGLPPFMSSFEQVVYIQLLTRYNEAIVMDYLVPFRLISPGSKGGEIGDPLLMGDTGEFMRQVEALIRRHRKDPTAIGSFPFPVQYQALGGEAKALAPVELIKAGYDDLLSSLCIPQEFYRASLKDGGPPISLRMFERRWRHFTSVMDAWLDWLMRQCSKRLMWEDVKARMLVTSVVEDDMTKEVKLNLLSANKVSNDTALSAFNLDYEYEVDKALEEQEMFDEKTKQMSKRVGLDDQIQGEMDNAMLMTYMPQQAAASVQGGPPAGGAPPGAGPGGPMPAPGAPQMPGGGGTLDEMMMNADQMAQQLLTMDPMSRRQQLIQLNKSDEALSALVKQRLAKLEQQAAQTGLNMTRQGQIPPPGQG